MRWSALAFACLFTVCVGAEPVRLGWVTSEPNPEIGRAIAAALTDIDHEVVSFNDKNALRAALVNRDIDLALLEKPEKDHPELRTLFPVFNSVLHVLVKTDNGVCAPGSLAKELVSAKVYAGPTGSAGHRVLGILATTGLAPAMDDMEVLATPFGDPPDAFFIFGGILSEDALSRLDGFCLRALDDHSTLGAGSSVEGLTLRYPQLEPFLIPRGLYPSLSAAPTLTVSIKSLLAAHAEFDEDLAYEIVERVSDIGPTIRHIYPLTSLDLVAESTSNSASLRLHPASVRFLQRDAPGFVERYAEVLAFGVTLMVALVTAIAALVGQRRRSRKERLDVYFVRLMEIRNSWESSAMTQQEAQLEAQTLRSTVIQLLVDERIDADQALVSFLLVSDGLLNDLKDANAPLTDRV